MAIKFLIIAFISSYLLGMEMVITNPKTTFIKNSKKDYYITAKKYIEKIDKNDTIKALFFPREFFLSNCYYENGKFIKMPLILHFKKAYKFSQKVHLLNVNGKFNNYTIEAKEAIYKNNKLLLIDCELVNKKKVIRRKKFILDIKK